MNGHPQDRATFTRSSGYVEQVSSACFLFAATTLQPAGLTISGLQADLHSPQTTVAEALWFSSRLRLPPAVSRAEVLAFTEQVSALMCIAVPGEKTWRSSCNS